MDGTVLPQHATAISERGATPRQLKVVYVPEQQEIFMGLTLVMGYAAFRLMFRSSILDTDRSLLQSRYAVASAIALRCTAFFLSSRCLTFTTVSHLSRVVQY